MKQAISLRINTETIECLSKWYRRDYPEGGKTFSAWIEDELLTYFTQRRMEEGV